MQDKVSENIQVAIQWIDTIWAKLDTSTPTVAILGLGELSSTRPMVAMNTPTPGTMHRTIDGSPTNELTKLETLAGRRELTGTEPTAAKSRSSIMAQTISL